MLSAIICGKKFAIIKQKKIIKINLHAAIHPSREKRLRKAMRIGAEFGFESTFLDQAAMRARYSAGVPVWRMHCAWRYASSGQIGDGSAPRGDPSRSEALRKHADAVLHRRPGDQWCTTKAALGLAGMLDGRVNRMARTV